MSTFPLAADEAISCIDDSSWVSQERFFLNPCWLSFVKMLHDTAMDYVV